MACPVAPAIISLLTTDLQLCLAHYCDLHGPTPLMVTEGLSVPCGRCRDDHLDDMVRPRSSAATPTTTSSAGTPTAVTDALRKISLNIAQSAPATVPELEEPSRRAPSSKPSRITTKPSRSTKPVVADASAVQTPPQSPHRTTNTIPEPSSAPSASRRDPSFQRTYDEYAEKRASPCANCALTLPERQDSQNNKDSPKPAADAKSDLFGPTMRTRAPYAHVYGSLADTSPPASNPQSSHPSDAEEETSPKTIVPSASSRRRPATSASNSSGMTSRANMPHHTHYIDYTSTHEPTVSATFTMVRASCLRTLSMETLPRRPEATPTSPTLHGPPSCVPAPFPSMNYGPGYITAPPTPQSASSGGPIFFGDPSAGYTTAYIFRIPDMHARGRKRVYAFLALSTHRERLAMKAFSFISAAFRDLASWVQELVDLEAERERKNEEAGSAVAAINAAYSNNHNNTNGASHGPRDSVIGLSGRDFNNGMGNSERPKQLDRNTSSFLTGGGRSAYMQRMGGSMGPSGFTPKARGLAELTGLPDFFFELHRRFVTLLLELGIVLGS
ncbi:vesicle coat protein [Astrocystis sublimbata]|nr:vesicle coat protein [Astrocystis sublimbata]